MIHGQRSQRCAVRAAVVEADAEAPGAVLGHDLRNPLAAIEAGAEVLLDQPLGELANALTHGAPDRPVRVHACSDEKVFELSVVNYGEPIPPDALGQLFQPFSRASTRSGQQGLGLGLYIAAEIARAHEGRLEAASSSEETRFTLRMPNRQA